MQNVECCVVDNPKGLPTITELIRGAQNPSYFQYVITGLPRIIKKCTATGVGGVNVPRFEKIDDSTG